MCNCSDSSSSSTSRKSSVVPNAASPSVTLGVPLAAPIGVTSEAVSDATADDPSLPQAASQKPCKLEFLDGCYVITHRPIGGRTLFEGTLRVDRAAPDAGPDGIIVSGDLYVRKLVADPPGTNQILAPVSPVTPVGPGGVPAARAAIRPAQSIAAAASSLDAPLAPAPSKKPIIPIFPRSRYHSYLKVTSVQTPTVVPTAAACRLTIVADQFNYTQPPAGQHQGTFPATATRTVTMKLKKVGAPFPFSLTGGPFYEGRLFEAGVDKGSVTLAWVSSFFRRASLEIDTLTGAVPPAPVPDGSGGMEFFDTVFAKTGWHVTVLKDQANVPVPPGIVPTDCWSSPDLHSLMTSVRNPSTNLDTDWHVHLVVVPAKLGCSRGVMYDQIGVPREGCASFSDDGYPVSDSSNFGVAANQKQRNTPRAYLRSAAHEVTHTLNQIHQESETAADNSIMTTTPSVADVLGGPGTGLPGVFPDQIALAHNTTVRHHLNHMPDPVIRPGGWPFASWFPAGAPQAADRHQFDSSELELVVTAASERVALGQPLELSWTLTNRGSVPLVTPNDVSIEALFAAITTTDGEGRERPVRPFTILCESAKLDVLDPGAARQASVRVFWSTAGFAFERPGRYRVNVFINWSADGVPVGVTGGVDVFVDYPASDADNQAAGLVMHPEVGTWVALGGGAYHLEEATRRLSRLTEMSAVARGDSQPRLLSGFAGLMPDRRRVIARTTARAGRTGRPVKRAKAKGRRPTSRRKR
jgi:hypothetical protein